MFCIPRQGGGIGYDKSYQGNHSAKAIESLIGTWAVGQTTFSGIPLWILTNSWNLGNVLYLLELVSPVEEQNEMLRRPLGGLNEDGVCEKLGPVSIP